MAANDWLIEAARAGLQPSPYDVKTPAPPLYAVSTAEDIAHYYAMYGVNTAKPVFSIAGVDGTRDADVWAVVMRAACEAIDALDVATPEHKGAVFVTRALHREMLAQGISILVPAWLVSGDPAE